MLKNWLRGEPLTVAETAEVAQTVRDRITFGAIDSGTLYGVQNPEDATTFPNQPTITRREAMSVPAVKRGRDLIVTLGTLPLQMVDENNEVHARLLLSQPEAGIPSIITWTSVVDDLIFYPASWLNVVAVGLDGLPADTVRWMPDSVAVPKNVRAYRSATGSGTAERYDPDPWLIRIDSPNDPLLVAGARAIRALGRLEQAALNAADGVPPNDFFTPRDHVDPFPENPDDPEDDGGVAEFLDDWKTARQKRSTAYVPYAVDYNTNSVSPKDLQLVEAREMAITEIARLMGIDAEELGISTTSRTYANMQDRRRQFLDLTLGPYMRAIESRLSMDDVTPPGMRVRFDTTQFVAADDKTTAETDQLLADADILGVDEIRARRGLAPRTVAPTPATDHPKEITA